MAFETFLTVDKQKPRKGRRITFLVSLAVHGVMLAVGVAMSFASVDEISPKNGLPITFWNNLPPPPPPPPAGKKTPPKVKKTATKSIVRPPTNTLVAPTEQTKKEEVDTDDPPCDGPDCTEDGKPGEHGQGKGEVVTKMLPPNVAKGFLAIDPQDPRYRPQLPPGVRHAGMSVSALLRVCVDRDGRVVDVKVLRGDDQPVNDAFIAAVRTWRYQPFKVDGRPVPFCTPVNYTVQTTN
jgi:protein TonB